MQRPLNLVWPRQTLEAILEGYFIKEVLLSEIGRPIRTIVVEANAPFPFLNDALVVSFGIQLSSYLKEARSRGLINIGLLHMADEHGGHDRSFYGFADYVLRHYWHERALVPPPNSLGVIWIPNGYRTGIGPIMAQTMLTTAERRLMGFFSGVLKGRTLSDERLQMVNAIQAGKLPFLVNESTGFGQGLGPVAYAAYLSMTRFGLVPGGNSPETIRLYEVLEAGAIPVVTKSPFMTASDALGNPPFVVLDNWSQLPAFYAPYSNAMEPEVIDGIEGRRCDVYNWWNRFKALQQQRVRELIDRSFARAYGEC
jgi:hypothetical protein